MDSPKPLIDVNNLNNYFTRLIESYSSGNLLINDLKCLPEKLEEISIAVDVLWKDALQNGYFNTSTFTETNTKVNNSTKGSLGLLCVIKDQDNELAERLANNIYYSQCMFARNNKKVLKQYFSFISEPQKTVTYSQNFEPQKVVAPLQPIPTQNTILEQKAIGFKIFLELKSKEFETRKNESGDAKTFPQQVALCKELILKLNDILDYIVPYDGNWDIYGGFDLFKDKNREVLVKVMPNFDEVKEYLISQRDTLARKKDPVRYAHIERLKEAIVCPQPLMASPASPVSPLQRIVYNYIDHLLAQDHKYKLMKTDYLDALNLEDKVRFGYDCSKILADLIENISGIDSYCKGFDTSNPLHVNELNITFTNFKAWASYIYSEKEKFST